MDSINLNLTIDSVALARKAYVKFLGIYKYLTNILNGTSIHV